MTRFRLAAVGDNCVDRFLPPVSVSLCGGNAVNVAVQWSRLGEHANYFGAVGPDEAGRHMRAAITQNGVDCQYLVERPGITAFTDIQVMPSGERVMTFEDFGVCQGYRPDEAAMAALLGMDHVHIGWLDDGGALRQRLAEAGVSSSQDLSVNNAPEHLGVDGLAYAFVSAGDAPDEAEAMIERLLAGGARMAVATLGSAGAMAASRSARASVGTEAIEPLDTTGAGDSFIAAFLLAQLRGETLEDSLNAGCRHAAKACLHVGGFPQDPRPF